MVEILQRSHPSGTIRRTWERRAYPDHGYVRASACWFWSSACSWLIACCPCSCSCRLFLALAVSFRPSIAVAGVWLMRSYWSIVFFILSAVRGPFLRVVPPWRQRLRTSPVCSRSSRPPTTRTMWIPATAFFPRSRFFASLFKALAKLPGALSAFLGFTVRIRVLRRLTRVVLASPIHLN